MTAAILAVTAVAIALAGSWPHRELSEIVVGDRSIDGLDVTGRTRWSYALPERTESFRRRAAQILDLTGDDHPDAVATAILASPGDRPPTGVLYALDENGGPLWHRSIEQHLSFGSGDFDGPWMPDDVMAFRSASDSLVAWAVHHLTWWPSLLAVYDARGDRVGTFVNAGWIRTSQPSADGRHIITGGFSNSRHGAAFAVLDARRPDGASPEDPGSPYECRNCPAGRPDRYFVVEWSDVATALPPDEREAVVVVHPAGGGVELRAQQRRGVELIVELTPAFDILRRAASDGYWEWHRRLEHNGTVTHGRASCPYRDGPIVREWRPDVGWRVHGG